PRVGWAIVILVAVVLGIFLYVYYSKKATVGGVGGTVQEPAQRPGGLGGRMQQIEEELNEGGMLIIHFAN
ncbi:MAG: hypothetical protein ACK4G3_05600, partial [bacterium]